jgi:outer membrane protein OmpU
MKTLLLASTALVATVGIAAAGEVKLTGYAEMGIVGGDNIETQFHHDFDIKFALSGESDGGVAFGATIDLDEVSNGIGSGFGPHSVFVSYAGATVTLGDTDGALDWAMAELEFGASIADDHTVHAGFNGNSGLDGTFDGQIARAEYTVGDFSGALSIELDDSGVADPVYGLAAKYKADLAGASLSLGLGYQTQEDTADLIGLSVMAEMTNGLSAGLNYTTADVFGSSDDITHLGVGVGYKVNALQFGVNYGVFEEDGDEFASGLGVVAQYDLGGGLSAHFGYGNSDVANVDDFDTYSVGLAMSF